jgi:hypothetical protein
LQKSGKERDGQVWIYNTYGEWHEQMPFWSERTIQRIVGNLIERKLVLVSRAFNTSAMDKTNWYAIDYEALARLTERVDDHDNLSSSTRQLDVMQDDTLSSSLTEINQETNGREKRPTLDELQKRYDEQERILRRARTGER